MIHFSINRFVKILLFVTAVLITFNLLAVYSEELTLDQVLLLEIRESFVRLFSLDKEANVPTWFSSSMLLLCSILLFVIALIKRSNNEPYTLHWFILALTFLGLSLDETAIIHEMSIKPLQAMFHTTGMLKFAWVIPGSVFVMLFFIGYYKFLMNLVRKHRHLFLSAGFIYVLGAICVESLSGWASDLYGKSSQIYGMIITLEEGLEMVGIIIFIHALLLILMPYLKDFRIVHQSCR